MAILGLEDRTVAQVEAEIAQGAHFVVYQWCASFLILTIKRGSDVHYIAPGRSRVTPGWEFTLITFLVGWWGIPWGPIYSIQSLITNFRGGRDVTLEIMYSIAQSQALSSE